jgi:hypothetical protein
MPDRLESFDYIAYGRRGFDYRGLKRSVQYCIVYTLYGIVGAEGGRLPRYYPVPNIILLITHSLYSMQLHTHTFIPTLP